MSQSQMTREKTEKTFPVFLARKRVIRWRVVGSSMLEEAIRSRHKNLVVRRKRLKRLEVKARRRLNDREA